MGLGLPSAFSDCEKSIALNPKEASALHCRGVLFAQAGEAEESIEECTKSIQLDRSSSNGPLLTRSAMYAKLKNGEKALDDAESVLKLNPNNGEAYMLRADAHKILGNTEQSAKDRAKAIELGYKPKG